MIYGPPGIGKAQPLYAEVLTPSGFRPIGDLAVGDQVIGGDGLPHRVVAVHPQGKRMIYRVITRDQRVTECCDEHLWRVQVGGGKNRKGYNAKPAEVLPLRAIRELMGRGYKIKLPAVEPVQFPERELPLDPWTLGVLIGDGCLTKKNIQFINSESDIRERYISVVESLGDQPGFHRNGEIAVKRRKGQTSVRLKQIIAELGLLRHYSYEKFVPAEYLLGSVEQRTELLRGLMDTDGYVREHHRPVYSTSSPALRDAFIWLVRSLGGVTSAWHQRAAVYNRREHDEWKISAALGDRIRIFSSRKHSLKITRPLASGIITIKAIEPVGERECRCITVDTPDGTYVTDDFIVTHNSSLAAQAPEPVFIDTEDGLGTLDVAKFPLATSYDEVKTALTELATEEHAFKTIVIDSLDWLERLIWAQVCQDTGAKNIEQAGGGYARGYMLALTYWREVIDLLNRLRIQRQMMPLMIAHAKVEKFEDPEGPAYDRYLPRLHKHACGLVTEWCDAVLFATRRVRTYSEDAGFGRKRTTAHAIGKEGGERLLRTIASPSCLAKNRYGMAELIPMSWQALADAIAAFQKEKKNG